MGKASEQTERTEPARTPTSASATASWGAAPPHALALGLQRAAGNRAASMALSAGSGQPVVQRWPFSGHGYLWNRKPSEPAPVDDPVVAAPLPVAKAPTPAAPTPLAASAPIQPPAALAAATQSPSSGKDEVVEDGATTAGAPAAMSKKKRQRLNAGATKRLSEIHAVLGPKHQLYLDSAGLAEAARRSLAEMLAVVGAQEVAIRNATSLEDQEAAKLSALGALNGKTVQRADAAIVAALAGEAAAGTKVLRDRGHDLRRDIELLKAKTGNPIIKQALDVVRPEEAEHRTYDLPARHTNDEVARAQQDWVALSAETAQPSQTLPAPDAPTETAAPDGSTAPAFDDDAPTAPAGGIGPTQHRQLLDTFHAPGGATGVKAKYRGGNGVMVNAVIGARILGVAEMFIHLHAPAPDEDRVRRYWLAQHAPGDNAVVSLRAVPASFTG